jgi:hypothetical protein
MPRYIETMQKVNAYLTPAEKKELMRLLKKLGAGVMKKEEFSKAD